eukprot:2956290-Rhodomonas_salina.1
MCLSSPYPIFTAFSCFAKSTPAAFDMCFGLGWEENPSTPISIPTRGKSCHVARVCEETKF